MLTTALDLLAVVLICAFCFFVLSPYTPLLVLAAACLLMSRTRMQKVPQ